MGLKPFGGDEALSAKETIAEIWDGRLRGGHWSGLRRRREGSLLQGVPARTAS